jgi:YNFM family putative membrane transporter
MVLLYSSMSFIPLYIVDQFGISKSAAAAMLALCVSGGLWAGPLGGYLSDRVGKLPVLVAAGIIGGPAIYLMNVVPFGWTFSAVLILIGMAQYLSMPVVEAYVLSNVSESRRSTVLGIYYLGSRGGPGLITPAIGFLIDQLGFNKALTIVAVVIVVITIAAAGVCLWKRELKLANR